MAEVNIDVAKESTGQQILNSGAKESSSQSILSKIGNSGGGTSGTLFNEVETLKSQMGEVLTKLNSMGGSSSVIRHIQRGYVEIARTVGTKDVALSGFSNLSKMMVLLDGARQGSYMGLPYVLTLSVNNLQIGIPSGQNTDYVSYQVIEFN